MSEREKLLLLDLILQDIRGNWAFDIQSRIAEAFEIAQELELDQFINSIDEYEDRYENGNADGRFFSMSYENGGYIGLDQIHGLPYSITGRSEEFKKRAGILTFKHILV